MAEEKYLLTAIFQEWRTQHAEQHKDINRHISTFHNRMWKMSGYVIAGQFMLIGSLVAFAVTLVVIK